MKKSVSEDSVPDVSRTVETQVIQTLRNMHNIVVKLTQVDFPFFSSVKVVNHRNFLARLAQRISIDLKEINSSQTAAQAGQIKGMLKQAQATGEHFAFYSPRNDALYLDGTMIARYPQKLHAVCAHELAEKFLSGYAPSSEKASSATNLFLQVVKTRDTTKLHELQDAYLDTVFTTIFKEGCCEAIAVQTLRSIGCLREAEVLETDLLSGYRKCIGLLSRVDEARNIWACIETGQATRSLVGERIAQEVLELSQLIKATSYYIGYPLAKVVLEKHGFEGVRFALTQHQPLKTKYFAHPETYLAMLGNIIGS